MIHSFPGRALGVFAFLAFVTVQYATGFVYHILPFRPRPLVRLDHLLDSTLTAYLGRPGAILVLLGLALLVPLLVHRPSVTHHDEVHWE